MASQPGAQFPLFYQSVTLLQREPHGSFGLKPRGDLGFTRATHAIPVTVDEFPVVQRHYPIVFGVGDQAVPLALVGLQEGQNLYLGADDQWEAGAYIPAYVRRYPFMLVQTSQDQLSLAFDDKSGIVVPDEGEKLFAGEEPSDTTKAVLQFCENFEQAVSRTRAFMDELQKLDLMMDGEVTIQRQGLAQPAVYRGFRMIDEQKLQNLRGDQARKLVQSGRLGLVYAHLFSLALISPLFEKQLAATQAEAA